jgi:hypothetical protein
MSTLSDRVQRLKAALSQKWTSGYVNTSDSGYGSRPANSGPIEDMSITLTPVTHDRDGLEVEGVDDDLEQD